MTPPQPVRAIVFDLFDTLVDLYMERIPLVMHEGVRVSGTAPALHQLVAEQVQGLDFGDFVGVLREVDLGFRESRYAKGLELPTGERFAAVVSKIDSGLGTETGGLVDALTEAHMGALREQVGVLDHHGGVMRRLRERLPLALCSNFSHTPTALRVLDDAGLREFLDPIVISDQRGIRKPRPEIFREVLAALQLEPGEVLHVGDNLEADVAGASALGIRTVWLTRRIRDAEERLRAHEGPAPDFQLQDLAELEPLIERLGAEGS